MNKLLEKYQEPLFTFLHTAHINDSIVDDTLAWISSVADYLRHSQQRLVHLANILPSSEEALESFATELDELVKYHRQKRDLQTSRAFDQQGKV